MRLKTRHPRTRAASDTQTPVADSQIPAIAVSNLHVGWDANLVLHGVTVTIPQGQVVAITGSNGSGKSTLIRSILGNTPITLGNISIFDIDIQTKRSQVPWERVGYVPQRVSSGGGVVSNAYEVVESGLLGRSKWLITPGDKKRVLHALDMVGLKYRAHDPMNVLSGGQQQRVLIARALVRKPDLLIMDEPMAGIDAASRVQLADTIAAVKEAGTTVVIILHELGELGPLLDRELHIGYGHITYDGAPHLDDSPEEHREPHHHIADDVRAKGRMSVPSMTMDFGGQKGRPHA